MRRDLRLDDSGASDGLALQVYHSQASQCRITNEIAAGYGTFFQCVFSFLR